MYVCHCCVVTDGAIREIIADGADDLDMVGERCGAGTACGGCVPAIERLLAAARGEPVPVGATGCGLGMCALRDCARHVTGTHLRETVGASA